MFQMSDFPVANPNNSNNSSTGGSANHKLKYKNSALDAQELRRRREEEGIQLRKQKREQQLFKKRNVSATETLQVPWVRDRLPKETTLERAAF